MTQELSIENNILILGSNNKWMGVDVYFRDQGHPIPIVIYVHGFKGFKDWGHFDLVAREFAKAGFAYVKFNFSHNGTTPENPTEFNDLEAFGNNNYILELNDLKTVIDWLTSTYPHKEKLDANRIYLLGHSRGGGIAILKAYEDERIKKIATWGSVSDLINRNKKATIQEWMEKGVVYTPNARTKQNMPLYKQFYETIQQNKVRLNIPKAASQLKIPFLIVHGTNDEAVAFSEAESLHRYCKHSEFLPIENGDHTFGAKHPYTSSELPIDSKTVVEKTIAFFLKDH